MINSPVRRNLPYILYATLLVISVAAYALAIYNIVNVSIAIDAFPINWTQDRDSCNGIYHFRIFLVGSLVCSLLTFASCNMSSCIGVFPIIWAVLGMRWLADAHDCAVKHPNMFAFGRNSEIILWANVGLSVLAILSFCCFVK